MSTRIKQYNAATTAKRQRPIKTAGYCHAAADAKQARKRTQAELRQEKYSALSTDEKIERAQSRRGESLLEVARLRWRDYDKTHCEQ